MGLKYIYTEGTRAGDEGESSLFNLPCAFGCSGSGIFNSSGELISVIFAGNGIPTSFPLFESFDTAKVIGISFKDLKEFVGDLVNE